MREVIVGVDAGSAVWIGVDLTRDELRRLGHELPEGHEVASFVIETHLPRLSHLFKRAITSKGRQAAFLDGAIVIRTAGARSLRKENACLAALPRAARLLGERLSKADLLEVAWDLTFDELLSSNFGDAPTAQQTVDALIHAVQERRRVGGRVPLTPRETGRRPLHPHRTGEVRGSTAFEIVLADRATADPSRTGEVRAITSPATNSHPLLEPPPATVREPSSPPEAP